MNTLSATELRKNIFELLNLVVYKGEEFLIKKDGKPVARLVPIAQDKPSEEELRKTLADYKKHFSKFPREKYTSPLRTPAWRKKDKKYLDNISK